MEGIIHSLGDRCLVVTLFSLKAGSSITHKTRRGLYKLHLIFIL
jgi:hypothetical protein